MVPLRRIHNSNILRIQRLARARKPIVDLLSSRKPSRAYLITLSTRPLISNVIQHKNAPPPSTRTLYLSFVGAAAALARREPADWRSTGATLRAANMLLMMGVERIGASRSDSEMFVEEDS